MAIIVDHADSGCHTPQLETAVHAAEIFQSAANVIGLDVESDPYRNRCCRVQNIVHARHSQAEFTKVTLSVGDLKPGNSSPFVGFRDRLEG